MLKSGIFVSKNFLQQPKQINFFFHLIIT